MQCLSFFLLRLSIFLVNDKGRVEEFNHRKLKVDINYINKILGLNLNTNQVKNLLRKMGLDYVNNNALAPSYRADIIHPIDIVEEVAIAYGYEKFKEKNF